MNHALARSTTSDFGTDSMFEKSRCGSPQFRLRILCVNGRIDFRTSRPDEDAPPVASVNDMMNDIPPDSSQSRFQPRVGPATRFRFCRRADTSAEFVCFFPSSFTRIAQTSVCTFTTIHPTTSNSKTSMVGLTTGVCYCIWLPT